MPFVNTYEFRGASRFRKTIPAAGSAARPTAMCLATGAEGSAGLAALIANNGDVLWAHNYSLKQGPLAFHDGVAAGSGSEAGFVLLSALETPAAGQGYVVVRIDLSGNLKWARLIRTDRTGLASHVRRLAGGTEEFLLLGRGSDPGSNGKAIELIRLRADGVVLRSTHVKLGTDDEILDAVPFLGSGYALVGTSARTPGRAGLLVYLDRALNVRGSWLLTGSPPALTFSPQAVVALPPNRLVLAGPVSPDGIVQSSMIAEIRIFGEIGPEGLSGAVVGAVKARSVSFTDGHDLPAHMAAIGSDILVFDRPSAFVRPQTVGRFDGGLETQAHYGFNFPGGAELQGLEIVENETVLIAGADTSHPPRDQALLLSTGRSLECCKTKILAMPEPGVLGALMAQDVKATVTDVTARNTAAAIAMADRVPKVRALCGMIEPRAEQMLQSPYLALQSAGSTGIEASRGILLRWHLAGVLGDSHLPKGTLAQTTVNFNKPDDFVTIYRAPWPGSAVPARQLSFVNDKPVYVDDANRLWVFETGTGTPRDLFYVRFLNGAAYSTAQTSSSPAKNPAGFLAAYGANPIEVELRHRLAVACDLTLQPSAATYTVRVETLSVGENQTLARTQVTSRRILGPADGTTPRLVAENMRSLRVACTGAQVSTIAFRCYDDVLAHVNQATQWTPIGRFALTLDQATAYLRLDDPARTQVHGRWWKFSDGAFVNVNNYRSRWAKPVDGIAAAVQQYLTLSDQDPQAKALVSGTLPEQGSVSISYLDVLRIATLDYHVARMLGLGHIDSDGIAGPTAYVHVAEYITRGDLGDGGGAREVQHLYMSVPTTLVQTRLPVVPDLSSIEYGLFVQTANGQPYWLTDQKGYTPDGLARYIRLYPDSRLLYGQPQLMLSAGGDFFNPPDAFDLAEKNLPTLYGVEYRKAGEPGWRKPAIAHDTDYADTAGVAEPVPTPFPPKQRDSAFIHKETEAGIHEYAVYGIDIFSRASSLSSPARATDLTRFRKPNRLLPPGDLKVQIIQEEAPLVLTTQAEQDQLAALVQAAASDPTLVRLTCTYAHVQEVNYGFADTIEILFRPAVPANVIAGVKAVGAAADPSMIQIETEPYTYLSTLETVHPVLPAARKANFLGGVLVAGNRRFTIADITWPDPATGENPVFVVRPATSTGVIETGAGHALVVEDAGSAIAPHSLILGIENMAAAASWGPNNPLAATIRIGDATWQTRSESFTRGDGTQVSRQLRGVWATATVTGAGTQYQIAFDSYVLSAHPQASAADPVTWHKGLVRVSVAGQPADDRRALTVLQVLQPPGGTLTLIAADDSGESGPIVTGTGQLVNYHPGYKLYFHADPGHGFDASAVTPVAGEKSRMTLLGARSIDHATLDDAGEPYRSPVGIPQLLSVLELVAPRRPDRSTGLAYAAPPDAYGKSSYTLTATFKHAPFAAAFYRADALTVLRALYSAETVQAIRAKIFPPEKDAFFANRWDDMFGFSNYPPGATDFRAFALDGGQYALPHPDAKVFAGDEATPLDQLEDKIEAAVTSVFLPLTEQPLIYSLIRSDPNYVPTNKKQTFRDGNRDVLPPGAPGFDLAPMARRHDGQGVPTIHFTDFTLDGSMNANTVYFYFVREISNRMQIGEASPVFGPVKLVNLSPPLAPVLRKVSTVPYDVLAARNPEVRFEIIAPSGMDPIAKLGVYRAAAAVDAMTVRTMTLVKEVDVAALAPTVDGTLIVADDFAGDPVVPYGDPLFYRLVCVRHVTYEDAGGTPKTASAASEPTRLLLASLLDIVNPKPPVPTLSLVSTTTSGDKLLRMTWGKTTHNGTYYVSRLGPAGNWMRLGTLESNDQSVTFDLPQALPVDDEDGNRIYYRFKVDVENSSGLLNLVEAPVTARLDTL